MGLSTIINEANNNNNNNIIVIQCTTHTVCVPILAHI